MKIGRNKLMHNCTWVTLNKVMLKHLATFPQVNIKFIVISDVFCSNKYYSDKYIFITTFEPYVTLLILQTCSDISFRLLDGIVYQNIWISPKITIMISAKSSVLQ